MLKRLDIFCLLGGMLLLVACRSASAPDEPRRPPSGITSFGVQQEPTLLYLVLGDSTAAGVGGEYREGIAVSTARHLAASRHVEMKNLAVSGAQVSDVLEEQVPRIDGFVPDVVLLSVGSNDVTHLTTAKSLERDLNAIVDRLVALNCEVEIVLTGAADMTTPPRIPRLFRGLAEWRTNTLNDVFGSVAEDRNLTFAPIAKKTGPLFARDRGLFSEDEFHPNTRGYQTWIEVINPALDRALESRSSLCDMTEVLNW